MAISEATALARARATKASFPKGTINTTQARAMSVAMAASQVGYTSGSPSFSMYGKPYTWPEDCRDWNGRQVYWCVLGGHSWTPAWAFGRAAALAGFGLQSTSRSFPPVGGTWTVWALSQGRAAGRVVPFNDAQSGDYALTDWDRVPGAEVDHYDIVTGPRVGNLLPVIGFNTSVGDASAGAGVFRAWRPRSRVVAVIRPDWSALVSTYNATVIAEEVIDWTAVHRMLLALGYPATEAGVKAYQKDRGLTVDGIPGPITTAALEADVKTIQDVLAAVQENNELTKNAINAAEWGGPKRVEGNLIPRFNEIPAAVADALLARRPDPKGGPRHKRFRYHDVQSQLLYAADGGLAAGAQIAALTAAVKELAANRGVDGDALVAAVTTAADRAASEQAVMDVAVDVDQEES